MNRFRQFENLALHLLLTAAALTVRAQGNFQNLNFESSLIPQTQAAGSVSAMNAFPGWTTYISTQQLTQVGFNDPALGSTWVSLQGTNTLSFPALAGGFSALLQGGISPLPTGGFVSTEASIEQTGLIPQGSQSIRFQALAGSASLVVSLGGQPVQFSVVSNFNNIFFVAGDVSSFAGQTVDLRFSALPPSPGIGPSNWEIDSIVFSAQSAPEPNILGLFALGCLVAEALLARRR